jgi:hypothetical protein
MGIESIVIIAYTRKIKIEREIWVVREKRKGRPKNIARFKRGILRPNGGLRTRKDFRKINRNRERMSRQDILSPGNLEQKLSFSGCSSEKQENHQEASSGKKERRRFRCCRKNFIPEFEGSVLGLEFDRKLGQVYSAGEQISGGCRKRQFKRRGRSRLKAVVDVSSIAVGARIKTEVDVLESARKIARIGKSGKDAGCTQKLSGKRWGRRHAQRQDGCLEGGRGGVVQGDAQEELGRGQALDGKASGCRKIGRKTC